jgi:hypothetical protein
MGWMIMTGSIVETFYLGVSRTAFGTDGTAGLEAARERMGMARQMPI